MVVCGVSILVMGILVLHVNKRKAAVGSCSPLSVSYPKLTHHHRSCRTESFGFLLSALPSLPARLKWLHSPTGLDRPCCPHSYPRRHHRCPLLGPPYEWHCIHSGVQPNPSPPSSSYLPRPRLTLCPGHRRWNVGIHHRTSPPSGPPLCISDTDEAPLDSRSMVSPSSSLRRPPTSASTRAFCSPMRSSQIHPRHSGTSPSSS